MKDEIAVVTVGSKQKNGIKRPVLHVLMADGRVTEFKSVRVVVPEGDNPDGELDVFAVLINRNGVPYVTPDGELAVVPCLPFALGFIPDQGKMLSLAQIATKTGLSLSTVKRAVDDGSLKGKVKLGKRKVGIRVGDVEEWLSKMPVKIVGAS